MALKKLDVLLRLIAKTVDLYPIITRLRNERLKGKTHFEFLTPSKFEIQFNK